MKNFIRFFILTACVGGAMTQVSSAQDQIERQRTVSQTTPITESNVRGYTLGAGDVIEIKVMGEETFNGIYTVDEDGKIIVTFTDKPIQAGCRTEREVKDDITAAYKKYLKNPQINFRVTEKHSRPPAVISGEVRSPQQVIMNRRVRLVELLNFAGGVTERSNGSIQVVHTQPLQCAEPGDELEAQPTADGLNVPQTVYMLRDLREGKNEANPLIRPGDVVIVEKAAPVFVVGEVRIPQQQDAITIPEGGLTLTEAVARSGGLTREAKKKDVRVYRLKKAGSRERETIAANLDLIKKGQQADVILQPYDVIEVEKAPKSIGQIISGIALNGITTFTNALPVRAIY